MAEQLDDELLAVAGTEAVDTFGDPEEEIVVEVDQARLAALEIDRAALAELHGASRIGEVLTDAPTPATWSDNCECVPAAPTKILTLQTAAASPEFSFGSQEPIGGGSVGSVGGRGGAFGRPFARTTGIVALTPVAFAERSGPSSQEMRRGLDAFDDFNRMRESSRAPSAGSKRGPGPFLAAPSGYGSTDSPWKRRLRSSQLVM